MTTEIISKFKSFSRIDYINYLIIIFAFTLSFPTEFKRFISILLILLWITDFNKNNLELPKTKIFLLFGIFVFYSLFSYLWSDSSIIEVIEYVKRYWFYLPIFVIFKYLKKDFISYALSSFLLGMLVSEILSYGNFFALWKIGYGSPLDPTVFLNHTIYSILLSITGIFLFIKIVYEKILLYKIFQIAFFTTVITNLFLNSGRTGYITFLITLIIIIMYKYKLNIRILSSTLLIIILLVSMGYTYSNNFEYRVNQLNENLISTIEKENYNTSVGTRIGFWIISKEILKDNLLFGVGTNNHINEKNKYIIKNNLEKKFFYVKKQVQFHNTFLSIATQLGFIGLSIFFLIIISFFKLQIKDPVINSLKIATLSIFLLASLSDVVFYLNTIISTFVFIMGIVLAQYRVESLYKIQNK